MSRVYETVIIQPARNGYWVEGHNGLRNGIAGAIGDPFVFETLDSLFKWPQDNYVSGTQPEHNGA